MDRSLQTECLNVADGDNWLNSSSQSSSPIDVLEEKNYCNAQQDVSLATGKRNVLLRGCARIPFRLPLAGPQRTLQFENCEENDY